MIFFRSPTSTIGGKIGGGGLIGPGILSSNAVKKHGNQNDELPIPAPKTASFRVPRKRGWPMGTYPFFPARWILGFHTHASKDLAVAPLMGGAWSQAACNSKETTKKVTGQHDEDNKGDMDNEDNNGDKDDEDDDNDKDDEVQGGPTKRWKMTIYANNLHVIPVDVIPSTKSWSIPSGHCTVVCDETDAFWQLSASIRFQVIKSETLRNLNFSSQILDLTSTSPKANMTSVARKSVVPCWRKKSPGGTGALMERQW